MYNLISNGLANFNGVGTCYEYGITEGELTEKMETKPIMPYPQGKLELFHFIQNLTQEFTFSFKWIRVFYVFGEIYGRKNLYTLLNQAIENKEEIFNMSGGEQIRDFLAPQAIAENIVHISLQQSTQGVINCCSGLPVQLKAFVLAFLKTKNSNLKLNLGFYPYPDYEPMSTWGSVDKLNLCKLK